jgi:hypothetical protein
MQRSKLGTGRSWRLLVGAAAVVVVSSALSSAGQGTGDSDPPARPVIPLDGTLHYGVSWAGIHCGTMTLESSVEEGADGPLYQIVMTARTSKFFDAIHRVRSRIVSVFSAERMSSVSYHERSEEGKKSKDSLWLVDFDQSRVVHTENDEQEIIAIDSLQVYDPLAFTYRVRLLLDEPGDQVVLAMVTSDGDMETVAEAVEVRRISTPFGKREALRIVPRPKDEILFSKEGSMSIWVATDDTRLPYRIVFDLSFGKLVAKLKTVGEE